MNDAKLLDKAKKAIVSCGKEFSGVYGWEVETTKSLKKSELKQGKAAARDVGKAINDFVKMARTVRTSNRREKEVVKFFKELGERLGSDWKKKISTALRNLQIAEDTLVKLGSRQASETKKELKQLKNHLKKLPKARERKALQALISKEKADIFAHLATLEKWSQGGEAQVEQLHEMLNDINREARS